MGRVLVLGVVMAACSTSASGGAPPAPVVSDVSPHAGDYGDTITVTGQNVLRTDVGVFAHSPDGARVDIVKIPNPSAIPKHDPQTNQDVPVAANAPLTFAFPFPAEGAMTLTGPNGDLPLGDFTPTFTPGHPLKLSGERVLGAAAVGAETAVLVDGVRGAGFQIFGAGDPRFAPIAPVITGTLDSVAAVRSTSSGVEALVTSGGSVWRVIYDGISATSAKYDAIPGLIGVAADDTGLVMFASDGAKFSRFRGAPPTATIDGPTVPVPLLGSSVTLIAIDGSVVYAWASVADSPLDDKALFSMKRLPPNGTDFGPSVVLDALDDDFKSLTGVRTGGVIEFSYCAIDSEPFSSPKDVCGTSYTVDGANKIQPSGSSSGITVAASMGSGNVLVGGCEEADRFVVHQLDPSGVPSSGEKSISPCSGVQIDALVPAVGGERIVLELGDKLWVAHRR